MKADFEIANGELDKIGIVRVASDCYMKPKKRGSNYFVRSPVSPDKTWSCCLYPSNSRFCDFANGNKFGDVIGFYSYIKNCNQWQALQELSAYYGLSGRQQDKEETQQRIQRQRAEEHKRAVRKQALHIALLDQINQLKDKQEKYRIILKKDEIEPFSDSWVYIQNEIQRTEYKLDVLTAADMYTYRRLKPSQGHGLPSDRPAWLLDCLAILEEAEAFEATEAEIRELTAQRAFESSRVPGRDRRCVCEW